MSDGRATNKCLEWKRQGVERGTATPHPLLLALPGQKNVNTDSKCTPGGFTTRSHQGTGFLHLFLMT